MDDQATDDACTFCAIVAGRLPARVLYEDDSAVAFLDIRPLRRGHTLVVPRLHVVDLTAEGAVEAVAAVGPALQQTTRLLLARLPAEGVSLLQANGPAAGQEVFHLHFHLVPRWTGDRPLTDWTPDAGAGASLDELHKQLAGRLPDRPPVERGRRADSGQRARGRPGMPRARSSSEVTRAVSIASSTRPFTAGLAPSCVRRRLPATRRFRSLAVSWWFIGLKCGARQRRGDVARRPPRRPPAETGSLLDVHHLSGG
ncbi:HIT family protein [Kribbella endophytica]